MLQLTLCLALAAVIPTDYPINLAIERVGSDLVLNWNDIAPAEGYRVFRSRHASCADSSVVYMTGPQLPDSEARSTRRDPPVQRFVDRGVATDRRPSFYWVERLRWTDRNRGIAARLTNDRSRVVFSLDGVLGSHDPCVNRHGASSIQAEVVDPLYLSHQPGVVDGQLEWQVDPAATAGYEVRRTDTKAMIPDMHSPPEPPPVPVYLNAPVSPVFPILDPALLTDARPILYYSVRGIAISCTPGQDTDNDRLDDCVETDTGIFVGVFNTGSDPNDADTDDDGIDDGDETLGTVAGLDLPALGSNPLRQDMFSEHDWMNDARGGTAHSHRPTPGEIDRVQAAYSSGPLVNPDGSTGIFSHNDYGQGAPFVGGNVINEPDADVNGAVNGTEFQRIKTANFDRALKMGYFFYVVHAHSYDNPSGNGGSSGYAEIGGNDCIVSTYNYGNEQINAGTIVHEQGHNLGLRHGGFEDLNRKPNYNSTMNYNYQFYGVDSNCDATSDGRIDYARAERIDLLETNLDENRGVCGNVAIDWNCDSNIGSSVVWDVNCARDFCSCSNAASATVLSDNDDWAQIDLPGAISDGDLVPVEVVGCQEGP